MAIETIPGAAASDLTTLLGTSGADTIETSATETKDLYIDALAGDDDITATEGLTNSDVEAGEGADSITFEGTVYGGEIQGGQDNDTISFEKDVENSIVHGGKDSDEITFSADLEKTNVFGDKGADTIDLDGEVLTSSILGGDANDTIQLSGRIDTSTVLGGEGDDSIVQDAAGILDGASIQGETGDDIVKVGGGKVQSAIVNGNQGEDVITVLDGTVLTTGSLNVYGGKNDDTVTVAGAVSNTTVSGDVGDDTVNFTAPTTGTADATVYGGDGDDTLVGTNGGELYIQGNSGDDVLTASANKSTVYGGKGDDSIIGGANDDELFGDKDDDTIDGGEGEDLIEGGDGDDSLTLTNTADAKGTINGGAGDDKITVNGTFAADTADFGEYTINGGAGEDTITIGRIENSDDSGTALLQYDSFAEFYSSGDTVDVISYESADAQHGVVTIEVDGALKFDDADDFDNLSVTDDEADLTLKTADGATSGSDVALNTTAAALFDAIDLNETTGSSKLDVSEAANAFTLTGGSGRNTLTGGDGADTIVGGATKDTITGSDGVDNMTLGDGVDTVVFASTGALNDDDVVTDLVVGTTGDVLDVTAFMDDAGTTLNSTTPLAASKTGVADADLLAAGAVDNQVVLIKGTVADYDAADEVADLFTVTTNANGVLGGALAVGEKAVIIIGANDGTALSLAFVDNAATAGIADGEVTIVGSYTGATADAIDEFVAGNFDLN